MSTMPRQITQKPVDISRQSVEGPLKTLCGLSPHYSGTISRNSGYPVRAHFILVFSFEYQALTNFYRQCFPPHLNRNTPRALCPRNNRHRDSPIVPCQRRNHAHDSPSRRRRRRLGPRRHVPGPLRADPQPPPPGMEQHQPDEWKRQRGSQQRPPTGQPSRNISPRDPDE